VALYGGTLLLYKVNLEESKPLTLSYNFGTSVYNDSIFWISSFKKATRFFVGGFLKGFHIVRIKLADMSPPDSKTLY